MPLITSTREARDVVVDVIKRANDAQTIQLGYIGKDNERRLPHYPAVVVSAGSKDKEYHGTHTYNVRLSCIVWVYHAKLGDSHATRSDDDIALAEQIEQLLEDSLVFSDQFISCYCPSVTPGMFQPAAAKGDLVVGTRIEWVALSQQRFK